MLNVEEVKLINKPNEHGYLYVKCLIDDSIEFKYSIEASTDDNIILNEILYDENKTIEKNILFNGIIENVRTTNIDKIYYLEIEALTSSSLLDIEQKSRSFQDEKMSYDDVIYEILKDYKGFGFGQCMSMPKRIEKPIFQYKETDYEFLKRIASHLGLELVSDIINMTNMFYFGKPKGKSYNIPDVHEYKATKNIDMYNKMVVFDENLHNTDYFYYEVKLRQSMKIGDLVKFKNRDFYVYKYEAEYIQGELIYKYRFCRQKGIWQEKIYNKKFSGMSLEGTVLETTGEILKLKLNIDEKQDINKAAWFVFAPPTGNIFYSMPLVGDNVMLYFQNEYDRPVVTGCVRKNGDTFGRCSNPDNRYYATESGNYLDMLPGAVNLYRGGMHVCFNDENGISMHSDTSISVEAPGSVTMDAETVFIKGNTKLFISKAKSGFLSFEGDLYNQAGIVYENGSCMEVFPPCEDGILDLNSPFGMNGDQGSKFNPTMDLVSAMAGSIPKSCASNTSDMPNYFLNDNLNKINPTGEVYTTNSHEISTTDKILDLLGIQTCCYAATRDDATKDEESQNTNNNSNQYSVEKLNDDISMSNDPIYSMGKNNIKKLNPSSEEIEIKGEGSYIRQDTGNKIPADSIEYFSSSAQYKPGDLVKIKGTNGNTIFGTAQEDGYIGTGAYKTYKFVPYNKEEYDKAISVGNTDLYKACKENEDLIKGIVSFAIDNTPISVATDTASFVAGRDIITGEDCNRGILAACILLPGFVDGGLKQAAKHSDDIGEFIVKNSDDIIDVSKKGTKGGTETVNNIGIAQSRINIANEPTRFSPSSKAGLEHVQDRHFNPIKNAGQFSISVDELKEILSRKDIIATKVTISETSGQFKRVANVGYDIGTVKPSMGGKSTSWIEIYTDSKGNLITAYPTPEP